jgi:hypothetical protein
MMVVATSLVALGSGAFPAWFGWLGFLVAVALVLNILYFFGLFVWVGWVLLASILSAARPRIGTARDDANVATVPSPPAVGSGRGGAAASGSGSC